MATGDSPEKSLRREVTRLGAELEQARVALEDAHEEVGMLTQECHALRRRVQSEELSRTLAERSATRAREQVACTAGLAATMGRIRTEAEEVNLSNALEEATVLAEELRESNEALQRLNEELEQRVADRTDALEQANQRLEALNTELNRRIEAETAARIRAQTDLFQMQKLDAIGQLSGGIAHDFNNLLSVVISGLELLAKLPPEQHARVLRRTEEAAWRGAHLTQRLLTFARRQVLQPERVELARQMESLQELFAHSLRENIRVATAVAPDIWAVEADPAAMELALLNLAVNARDAMPDGGKVLLTARNAVMQEGERGLPAGEYVQLGVVDNGTGMSEAVLQKVFEPFFTTKGGSGTGLGLAQVYGFAKQSGGTAWVESQEGRGTTVHLLLPRSHRPAQSAAPSQAQPPIRRSDKLSILVVEDDDDLAFAVLDMLGQLGHSGTRVITMAAALAVLMGGGTIDLVFSDVLLPGGGSGLDLAREIARRGVQVPIILTSGYGGGMTQRLAAAHIPFLRKPYRIEALRQAIDRALPARAEIAEALADG